MERNIVKHGPATHMISLPAKWIKEKGLRKGDSLQLDIKENRLILSLDKKKHKNKISLNLISLEESSIRTILTNAYRLGYDQINITYSDPSILKTIKELTEKNLLGFEITEKTNKSCKIENITEPSMDQFETIFSKVFMNISDLFEIGRKLLENEKEEFEDVDRKIQQFDNFCKRILVKNSLFENNFLQWAFHSSLIHASRELYHLFKYLSKKKIKSSKYETGLLLECQNIFKLISEAYKNRDVGLLEKVHEKEKEVSYKKGYDALEKSSNPIIVHHLITATKHFYLANSPLMGILMQKNN